MLNKSKGNMYSFINYTWNTIKGKCPHACSYCYCKSIAKRFNIVQKDVHLDEKEFKTNLGSGNFIFVGSSCDMFANDIPYEWIKKTFNHIEKYPNNKYLLQTKNPTRLAGWIKVLTPNISVCTTIETNRFYPEIMNNSPLPFERAEAMQRLHTFCDIETFVTIEPIMDFDLIELVKIIKMCGVSQCNLGADSGHNNLPEPSKDKVLQLIEELQKFTVIHNKTNLKRILCK